MLPRRPISRLDAVGFDELLRRCAPFDSRYSILDLQDVEFVTPAGLVGVAALCQALRERGRWASVELGSTNQRSYLVRAGLVSVLSKIATVRPTMPVPQMLYGDRRRGASPRLVEITPLGDLDSLYELLERIRKFARSELGYDRRDATYLTQVVSEVCDNSLSHNERSCGFLALQGYGPHGRCRVELGIADCGGGLAATLGRNGRHGSVASDVAAIHLAVQQGISQFDDPTRGTGLTNLLRVAELLRGTVNIRSGSARARFTCEYPAGDYAAVPWMAGVQISLTLQGRST